MNDQTVPKFNPRWRHTPVYYLLELKHNYYLIINKIFYQAASVKCLPTTHINIVFYYIQAKNHTLNTRLWLDIKLHHIFYKCFFSYLIWSQLHLILILNEKETYSVLPYRANGDLLFPSEFQIKSHHVPWINTCSYLSITVISLL